MLISGFSFVRNAEKYGFPVRESLRSLAPLCDEVVVAVGASEDDTLGLVRSIDGKIRTIETVWDDSQRQGGRVYAQQTDIALAECRGDWCIYLQGDEVLHEDDRDLLLREINRADGDPKVEALLFSYLHFYGNYDYIAVDRKWYRREVRVVRNTGKVLSWGDAQGFRTRTGGGEARKLRARKTDVRVFHYGWVRPPKDQAEKMRAMHHYWHDDAWIQQNAPTPDEFDYDGAYEVRRYQGTHPAVMDERVASAGWGRNFDPTRTRAKPFAMKISDAIEQLTGYRPGEYRNYITVR